MANLAFENNNEMYQYLRLTATGGVKSGVGQFGGFIVASGTPTVQIYDNTAASGALILNTMQTVQGVLYPFRNGFTNGCYVVITGTADITFFYN